MSNATTILIVHIFQTQIRYVARYLNELNVKKIKKISLATVTMVTEMVEQIVSLSNNNKAIL